MLRLIFPLFIHYLHFLYSYVQMQHLDYMHSIILFVYIEKVLDQS